MTDSNLNVERDKMNEDHITNATVKIQQINNLLRQGHRVHLPSGLQVSYLFISHVGVDAVGPNGTSYRLFKRDEIVGPTIAQFNSQFNNWRIEFLRTGGIYRAAPSLGTCLDDPTLVDPAQTTLIPDHLLTKLHGLNQRAEKLWGRESQITMLAEEMAELTLELARRPRGRGNPANILEEIVDVFITAYGAGQLQPEAFNEMLAAKLIKFESNIEAGLLKIELLKVTKHEN